MNKYLRIIHASCLISLIVFSPCSYGSSDEVGLDNTKNSITNDAENNPTLIDQQIIPVDRELLTEFNTRLSNLESKSNMQADFVFTPITTKILNEYIKTLENTINNIHKIQVIKSPKESLLLSRFPILKPYLSSADTLIRWITSNSNKSQKLTQETVTFQNWQIINIFRTKDIVAEIYNMVLPSITKMQTKKTFWENIGSNFKSSKKLTFTSNSTNVPTSYNCVLEKGFQWKNILPRIVSDVERLNRLAIAFTNHCTGRTFDLLNTQTNLSTNSLIIELDLS